MPQMDVYQDPNFPRNQMLNTTTNLPPEVADYFGGYVGMFAFKRCVLHLLGENTNIPAKSGTALVIPTYKRLEVNDIPYLKEGVTPNGLELHRDILKITPRQLGTFTPVSDVAILVVQSQILQHAARELGQHLTEVCDKIIATKFNEVLDVGYATGGVQTADINSPGYVQGSDIIHASMFLKANLAQRISPNLFGSTVFGSTPVSEAYYCYCNYKIELDLYRIPGFQTLAHYGSSQSAHWLPGELGAYLNTRFVPSQSLIEQTSGNNATVDKPYLTSFFLGRGAYYMTQLGYGATQFLYNPPGSGASGPDPVHQRSSVGYKSWFGVEINKTNKWIYKLVSRTSDTL